MMKLRGEAQTAECWQTLRLLVSFIPVNTLSSLLILAPVFAVRLMMKIWCVKVWWYLVKDTGGAGTLM